MSDIDDKPSAFSAIIVRILFASAGIFLVFAGLITLYAEDIGLDAETGDMLAILFLLVAAADALIASFLHRRARL